MTFTENSLPLIPLLPTDSNSTLTTQSSVVTMASKKRYKSHSSLKEMIQKQSSGSLHKQQRRQVLNRSTSDSGAKTDLIVVDRPSKSSVFSSHTIHGTSSGNDKHHFSTSSFLFNFGLKASLSTRKQGASSSSKDPSGQVISRSLSTHKSSTTRPLKSLLQLNSSKSTHSSQISIMIGSPTNNPEAAFAMHPLNNKQHIVANSTNQNQQTSITKKPTLPVGLQQDITRFAIDGFAQKYFSTHKRGLFRRTVPMAKMLKWTKDSINQPLIMMNKELYKDALRCFKLIQTVMGDRPPKSRQIYNDIEDIQAILSCGITKGQMRDEIYVQVCKQLNDNPSGDSIRKGWEILCIISVTFPPSKNLETYLTNFVQQNHHVQENHVGTMSQHVSTKLTRVCIRGAKGKVLTSAEIQRAKEAPFKPSVFGESLSFIMELQRKTGNTTLQIPQIVPFLTTAVRKTNGKHSEGIFRVPGDADAVTDLRVRIENGNYDATGVTDPNVPASLLKYWLRDLAEPIIPSEDYEDCIRFAEDAERAIAIMNRLPSTNRRIALFTISFLQEFTLDPEIIKDTLMNVNNLAMVFAPNFLRCPSESLTTVFENSKYEQAFLRTLIHHMVTDADVCAYDPDSTKAIGVLLK
ncbi:MAG: Rho GTPase activation protein [Benjaminiella poitrasii]|nr:MAG: Rho GTPase activation protein [Benjaminiella poitrasii]